MRFLRVDFYLRVKIMNKKTIIVLCGLIVVMTAIIVSGVSYLYKPVQTAPAPKPAGTAVASAESVKPAPEPEKAVEPVKPSPEPEKKAESVKPSLPQEFKVKNCGTGKQNTLRQNKDYSLQLIDETGKSLWSVALPGVVCGAVAEVDFYNNKKIQYLLCDGVSLHLFDRLGREVRGFPKSVGSDVIGGPEKIQHKGATYWKLETADSPVYYDYKATKVFTQLP